MVVGGASLHKYYIAVQAMMSAKGLITQVRGKF